MGKKLRRTSARRPLRTTYWLFVEGSATETEYFRGFLRTELRLQNVDVLPDSPSSHPAALAAVAKKKLAELEAESRSLAKDEGRRWRRPSHRSLSEELGQVWVVCDVDENAETIRSLRPEPEHRLDTKLFADGEPRVLWAVSNPCFDVWLIWHVEDYASHAGRHEVQRRASAIGLTGGGKGKNLSTGRLTDGIDTACDRAARGRQRHLSVSEFPYDVPSSDVDLLVQEIRSAESRPSRRLR